MKFPLALFLCLSSVLFATLVLTGCGCGDDDDDDDGADDDVDDDSDDDVDDDADDDVDSPVLDYPADETVVLPGLSAEARVAFDQYMIPYVFAGTDNDMALVMGYVQASQRFFQMDFFRRLSRGQLTEIAGAIAVGADLEARVQFMAADGRSVFEHIEETLEPGMASLLESYADGVNAWLEQKRAEVPLTNWPDEYFVFGINPSDIADWTVIDTISFARYQTWDLSGTLNVELALQSWADALPADLYDAVFPRAMATDTVILDGAKSAAPAASPTPRQRVLPEGYHGVEKVLAWLRSNRLAIPMTHDLEASNNWITSPDLNDGVGFLANDPHLSLTFPSVFTLGYLDNKELGGGDFRTWGAMFAGAPIIAIGANENLAWGETVAGYDVLDVYAETLVLDGGEPKAVMFDGDEVDLVKSTQSFADGSEIDVYIVPHHGPILPDSIDGATALSFRWTGHQPTHEMRAFRELATATSVDEGFAAIEYFEVGAQNFVMQDTNGDLGYYPHALVPERTWASTYKPWLVLPGDGAAEWGDYMDTPQVKNPAKGWLVTANNDVNGTLQSGDPTADEYWFFDRDIGYRAQRITEMIEEQLGGDGFSPESIASIQLNVKDNYARDLITEAIAVIGADESDLSTDAAAMLDYWKDWDFETHSGLAGPDEEGAASDDADERADSVAAMGFGVFEAYLREYAFGDEVADAGVANYPHGWSENFVAILQLMLDDPTSVYWDDVSTGGDTEEQRDIVVKALNDAVAAIAAMTVFDGLDIDEWYWGRMHNLLLEHVAFSAFGIPSFDVGPYAIPGSSNTPNVAGYFENGEEFVTTHGPSLRIVHEFADGAITTRVHYPGGQIPLDQDPHRTDMLDLWLAGDYYEMPHAVQPILDATEYMIAFVAP